MAQNDRHTDRHNHGHGDSMTDPAQRAESVKTHSGKKPNTWKGCGVELSHGNYIMKHMQALTEEKPFI